MCSCVACPNGRPGTGERAPSASARQGERPVRVPGLQGPALAAYLGSTAHAVEFISRPGTVLASLHARRRPTEGRVCCARCAPLSVAAFFTAVERQMSITSSGLNP